MAICFTDSFVVGTDTIISAYPAGSPNYAYNLIGTIDLVVISARSRVECAANGSNTVARIINASAPTGDQEITISTYVDVPSNSRGSCALRCNTSGTQNFYLGLIDVPSNTTRIYRCDSGTFNLLATSATITITTGAHTLRFRAMGTGSQVDLTLDYDAGARIVTFSDTNASRKTSGPPGIGHYASLTNTVTYIDDVSVENFITGGVPLVPNMAGNFKSFDGGMT